MDVRRILVVAALAAGLSACGGGGGSTSNVRPDEPIPPPEEVFDTTHLTIIKAAAAHDAGAKGAGITVAVLDTGIRATHEEFVGANVLPGMNVVEGEDPADVSDTMDHGTRVASLIVGQNTGVAPEATLLPVRVTPADTMTTSGAVITDGAAYARAQGAQIQNMSFSMANFAENVNTLNDNAAAGVLSVMAAGNEGDANPTPWVTFENITPEAVAHALVVGAVNADGTIAPFSDRAGTLKDRYLVAPGNGVNSADIYGDDSYSAAYGTSFATPVVSGAAAVVWGADPSLTADQVADILLTTADDLGDPGVDEIYGHGLLNLEAAIAPVGTLGIAKSAHTSEGTYEARLTGLSLSPAFGDALSQSAALGNVLVLDDFNRPYVTNLQGAVAQTGQSSPLAGRIAAAGQVPTHLNHDLEWVSVEASFSPGKVQALGVHDEDGMQYQSEDGSRLTMLSVAGETGAISYRFMDGGMAATLFSGAQAGGYWLAGAAPDLPHLSLLARDSRAAALGSSLAGWQLQAGYASGRTAHADSAGVDAGIVSAQTVTAGARWTLTLSHLIERETFLGAASSGALGAGSVAMTSGLGLGVDLPLAEGVSLFGGASMGYTDVDEQGGSMLANWRELRSSSYGVGVQVLNTERAIGLRVVRPLRVDSGKVDLDVPVERTLEHQILRERSTVELSPSGQELAIESYYRMLQRNGDSLGVNLMYRIEPNHVRSADPELATMLEGSLKW